jgi:hypothetical protein
MSNYDKSVFSGCGGITTIRGFCFGCDEGRNGKVLAHTKRFDGIPKDYEEVICEGCDYNLNLIRPFIIPVIQHNSHEGKIWWRIPKAIYVQFRNILDSFREYNIPYEGNEDEYTVILGVTDTGYGDNLSVDTLLEKLSQIRFS